MSTSNGVAIDREKLHDLICSVMEDYIDQFVSTIDKNAAGPEARKHVYYQPPSSLRLTYPCIVYTRSSEDVRFADNNRYNWKKRYTLTVMDKDPDSPIPDMVALAFHTKCNRQYPVDNIYHYIYDIYY